jgi:hypothetical protein
MKCKAVWNTVLIKYSIVEIPSPQEYLSDIPQVLLPDDSVQTSRYYLQMFYLHEDLQDSDHYHISLEEQIIPAGLLA